MSLGFENSPVTFSLSILILALSYVFGKSGIVSLDIENIIKQEFWRLFTSQFVFSNMAQTFFGLLLVYTGRQFERQLGSKKFGAFIFLAFFMSILAQFSIASIIRVIHVEFIPSSGPFFLIFSMLPLFHSHVPKLYSSRMSLFGASFSEKTWTYLFGLQLALSEGVSSLVPSVIGLALGWLYKRNIFGFQKFRLPGLVERGVTTLGSFVFSLFPAAPAPAVAPRREGRVREGDGFGGRWEAPPPNFFAPPAAAAAPAFSREPTEGEVESVMALGFERAQAIRALRQADNNVEAAVNILLQ